MFVCEIDDCIFQGVSPFDAMRSAATDGGYNEDSLKRLKFYRCVEIVLGFSDVQSEKPAVKKVPAKSEPVKKLPVKK